MRYELEPGCPDVPEASAPGDLLNSLQEQPQSGGFAQAGLCQVRAVAAADRSRCFAYEAPPRCCSNESLLCVSLSAL